MPRLLVDGGENASIPTALSAVPTTSSGSNPSALFIRKKDFCPSMKHLQPVLASP